MPPVGHSQGTKLYVCPSIEGRPADVLVSGGSCGHSLPVRAHRAFSRYYPGRDEWLTNDVDPATGWVQSAGGVLGTGWTTLFGAKTAFLATWFSLVRRCLVFPSFSWTVQCTVVATLGIQFTRTIPDV